MPRPSPLRPCRRAFPWFATFHCITKGVYDTRIHPAGTALFCPARVSRPRKLRASAPLASTAPGSISMSMSALQSRMYAAMEEALRARQKKRDAAEALRARQHEYETASLRGRQQQINRTRVAVEVAEAAYEAAKRDLQRLNDKAEEVV